ncbi:MAG: SMI1/KNR4 family protein [Parachlamydiales bacterium]|nr:SMI1/KNR4 family protein [Parachlamydiales bacterium]
MHSSLYDYYYRSREIEGVKDPFYEVLHIDENSEMSWYQLQEISPTFPKGWFELTSLSIDDRIEFSCDYWFSVFPYDPLIRDTFQLFFQRLDGIYFFLSKNMPDDFFKAEMVYSMKGGAFFRGSPPLQAHEKVHLPVSLPKDFISFLQIHNGFAKGSDTGIFSLQKLENFYPSFAEQIAAHHKELVSEKEVVNPYHLYPFYQSYQKNDYQCFYSDWSVSGEMGNLFFSGNDVTVSPWWEKDRIEGLSFATFFEWLKFYLE